MYSFINRTKPTELLQKDEKRKIRAHVSKSLAHRRRAEAEQSISTDPQTMALNGESAWRQHKLKKKRTSTKTNPRRNAEASGGDPKSSDLPKTVEIANPPQIRQAHYSGGDHNDEHHTVTEISPEDEDRAGSPYTDILRRKLHCEVEFDPTPEPMLATWTANKLPMHGDIMLRVCAFQMNSFRPEISIEQASDITGFVWRESPCTILSYALCLSALGHLQSTTPGSGNDVIGMFKGKVFREMIKQIPSMDNVISDELVPSIMCLTSFELSRVSLEARTHLQALNTIRTSEQHQGDIVSPMFEGLDLLHSLMFDLPTVSQLGTDSLPDAEDIERVFSVLREERHAILERNVTKMWTYIGEMLSHLEMLVTDVLNGQHADQTEADLFFEDLDDFRAQYCVGQQQEQGEEQYIARCIYHTCAILYNVLVNRRTFRNPSNKKHAAGLYFATYGYRRSASTPSHLQLWLLAVAVSTSRDAGEQSLFQNRIATLVYQLGATSWEAVRGFLCSFLRIRSQLDNISRKSRPQKRITKIQLIQESTPSASTSPPTSTAQPRSVSPPSVAMPITTTPPPTNTPHPTFIPLPHDSLTASVIKNAKIYPDLNEKYSFMPKVPMENIMSKGYAYLCQDQKFESMLIRGERGRVSMIGTTVPDVGWVSLF